VRAIIADQLADDFLRRTAGIGVRRVDEVDVAGPRQIDQFAAVASLALPPKSIVPRQILETRNPLFPRYLKFITPPLLA